MHSVNNVWIGNQQSLSNICKVMYAQHISNILPTTRMCIKIPQLNTQYCSESRVTEGACQQKHRFDATTGGQVTNHFLELTQFLSMLFLKSLQAHVGSGLIVCHVPGNVYDLLPSSDTGQIFKEYVII